MASSVPDDSELEFVSELPDDSELEFVSDLPVETQKTRAQKKFDDWTPGRTVGEIVKKDDGLLPGVVRSAMQFATADNADEGTAAINAASDALFTDDTFDDAYMKRIKEWRPIYEAAKEDHPAEGALLSMLAPSPFGKMNAAKTIGLGAAYGAASVEGQRDTGEDVPVGDYLKGAATGGLGAGIGYGVGKGIQVVGNKADDLAQAAEKEAQTEAKRLHVQDNARADQELSKVYAEANRASRNVENPVIRQSTQPVAPQRAQDAMRNKQALDQRLGDNSVETLADFKPPVKRQVKTEQDFFTDLTAVKPSLKKVGEAAIKNFDTVRHALKFARDAKGFVVGPGARMAVFNKVKLLAKTNPASLGRFGAVLSNALSKEGGDKEAAALHYSLATSNPEYQQMITQLDKDGADNSIVEEGDK